MNGIALTVMLSQSPKRFGFSVNAQGPLRQAWGIVQQALAGKTNLVTLAIGGSTLGLIMVLKRYPRVPGILLAVIAATLVVAMSGVYAHAGVSVIGSLPHGLPTPTIPLVNLDDLVPVLEGGLAVALVSFADTSVLSWTYMRAPPVDPNQEMVGRRRQSPLASSDQLQQFVAHPR
jgi:MFS superfamily sulfate permease-like transporter